MDKMASMTDKIIHSMSVVRSVREGIVTKLAVKLEDGYLTEVALIERPEKNIVCFSTMVGCPVGCAFCVSGVDDMYKRILTASEMYHLVDFAMWETNSSDSKKKWVFSAMGEGEPALNIAHTLNCLLALDRIMQLRERSFAISTSGPSEKRLSALIKAMEAIPFSIKLQYSLHSIHDRSMMIKRTSLGPAEALRILSKSSLNIELNVVLIKGLNDDTGNLLNIAWHLQHIRRQDGKPWYVKINRFNKIPNMEWEAASEERNQFLMTSLQKAGVDYEYYETDGSGINAACGQLHFDVAGNRVVESI